MHGELAGVASTVGRTAVDVAEIKAQLTLFTRSIQQRTAGIQSPTLSMSTIGAAQRGNEPIFEEIEHLLQSLGVDSNSIRENKDLVMKTLLDHQRQTDILSSESGDSEEIDVVFDMFDSDSRDFRR